MIIDKDDYLEHYGKKGMRWGIREGKKVTGYSRSGANRVSRNKAKINATVDLLETPLGIYIPTRKLQKIAGLQAQNDRIKRGETTVRDKLAIAGSTRISTLIIPKSHTYKAHQEQLAAKTKLKKT